MARQAPLSDGSVIVVAGPTASGKSALASDLAERLDGTVINADAMQVYGDLRLLTARPSPAEEARVPHRLYGVLDATDPCSAGRWRELAVAEIAAALARGSRPVVVGGTGLYLRTLMHGIAAVPPIPRDVRAATQALYERLGGPAFRAALAARDPLTAGRLHDRDRQRLARAWEVIEATGRPLADWQGAGVRRGAGFAFRVVAVLPPRQVLYAACNARLAAMIADGALAEVQRLAARRLDPMLPLMKAVGVRELLAHVSGAATLDTAVAAAQRATRRYAKRQLTWLRHQITPDFALDEQYSSAYIEDIINKIS